MINSSSKEVQFLSPLLEVRPMLMLTGFLGAGKTTLLRDILDHLASREHLADVIINDHENAYIDRETLKNHAADVVALTGSCVCCEGHHDLVDMILKASKSRHDVLLIELNGTADPVPLLESFTLLESKFCLRPRWQVCVVDSRYFRKRKRFNDLESLQLETASHYYISRSSELTEAEEIQLKESIKAINSRATLATASMLADDLSKAIRNNLRHAFDHKSLNMDQPRSQNFNLTPLPSKRHDNRHKIAHEFTGCSIIFPNPIEPSRVTTWLEKLPASVIRAKALVALSKGATHRYLYERVGQVISPDPISVRAVEKVPCSGIFIGADIDPEEILWITQAHLDSDCHFPRV
ncbi:MAG: CobW family GTP-binding protein [Akkermansiaceae bacterium]